MDEDVKQFFENLSGGSGVPEAKLASVHSDIAPAPVVPKKERAPAADSEEAKPEEAGVFDGDDFGEGEGQLTVDVFQTSAEIVIQSTIAGVDPERLEVSISNEMVTIRGGRSKAEEIQEKDYFVQELYWGKFSRSIILPQEVDADQASAELKNGILTIRLPKIKKQKIKKLKVKTV